MISEREKWLDALRGASISLVILHHCYLAVSTLMFRYGKEFYFPLYSLDTLLGLVRMPAFFLCSGILFATPAARGWGWFLNKRISWVIWIVALWGWATVILMAYEVNIYSWGSPAKLSMLQIFLIEPVGNMWFIYAIAILSFFCMMVRELTRRQTIILSFSLSILLLRIVTTFNLPSGFNQILGNLGSWGFLFFTIGFVLQKA